MSLSIFALAGLSFILTSADGEHTRQARAHTHGVGEALVAIEGNEFFVQISGPAANYITSDGAGLSVEEGKPFKFADDGFPFAASDVVSFATSAKCETETLMVERESLSGGEDHDAHEHEDHDSHDHEDHDEHDHDEHHEDHDEHDHDAHHEDHDEHDHDDHDHAEDHSGHSNILLTYEAHCESVDKIKAVDFKIFETWAGFETLETTFLTDDGSTATKLTSSKTSIDRP